MPEKIPDNMREAFESEAAGLEMKLATTEPDDPRRAGWEANLKAVQANLKGKAPRAQADGKTKEKRPQE